jgi:hypothetical protein
MKRVNFHLTDDQIEWLRAESKRTGLSTAELIRRAVDVMRRREEGERIKERLLAAGLRSPHDSAAAVRRRVRDELKARRRPR